MGAVTAPSERSATTLIAAGAEASVSGPAAKPMPAWEAYTGWVYLVVLIPALAVLVWLPSVASAYTVTLWLTVLLTINLASSWNVLSGYGGYVSFGHAGFFGVGSYIGALLLYYDKLSWIPAMIAAGLGTSLLALLLGYPVLRLRGPYFAIAMLAMSELGRIVVTSWSSVTLGGDGVYLPIVRFQRVKEGADWWGRVGVIVHNNQDYYAMLVVAILAVIGAYWVGTSRFGLELLSIRDDEVASQAMGTRVVRVKIAAFAASAFFPGIAGAIYARHVGYIDPPTVFGIIWSIRAIATALLGGQATILGPIIGAVGLTLVSERVWASDPNLFQVVFGGLIVLVVLFIPGGLISLLQQWGVLPRSRRI